MTEPLTDWRPHYPHTEGREAMWSPRHPYVQVGWDSTSLSSYMQCPRRYFYEIIHGWRQKAINADILFGSTVHDSIELYERERFAGAEHSHALRAAVRNALRMARGGYPDPVSGETLHSLKDGENPAKTAHTAVRVVVWWADQFGVDDQFPVMTLGDGRPGLEVSYRFPLDITTPDGEPYILAGHFDKLATYGGRGKVVERKTTKSALGLFYWDKFSPNVQISNYALASKIVLPEPAAGVVMEAFQTGVTFARIERHEVQRTQAYLDEWLEEVQYWIKRAEADAMRSKWPKNEAACNLNGGCPFRRICNKDPGLRDKYLKGEFQKLTWNPLRNR